MSELKTQTLEKALKQAQKDAKEYEQLWRKEMNARRELREKLDVFVAAFRIAKDLASEGEHE